MAKHNKKRNVGLLHEQLIRHASRMTVEGKTNDAQKTVDIVTTHFTKDTELLKEFRLFSSLIHTRVSSESLARRIVDESKQASKNHDAFKLQKEKSLLIRDINHILNEDSFYDQKIEKYKIFATVQALLDEWRGASRLAPVEIVKYEDALISHLNRKGSEEILEKKETSDPLVLNIMLEKFNKKYAGTMSEHQRKLLEYKLLKKSNDATALMSEIKNKTLDAIEEFYNTEKNDHLMEKKKDLVNKIQDFKPVDTDEAISRALSMANLLIELEEK